MSIHQYTANYLTFTREDWASLRDSVPMTLGEDDLEKLRGINEHISLQEVRDIYLPLTRLLNLYVKTRQGRSAVLDDFLLRDRTIKAPFIIGIAGSVAVGKSTTARLLQALLSRWPEHPRVELVTTDGFLYPNQVLNERDLMRRKGFPESYDIRSLVRFLRDIRAGEEKVYAPVYSHLSYDITGEMKCIEQPDILILEGLNVLQSGMDYPQDPHRVFISDFLDFSIYVDADTPALEKWYVDRFMKFRSSAFLDPDAYFHHYTLISEAEAVKTAKKIWREINGKNLGENILPTRDRANLVLKKYDDHAIDAVVLKK
ncbi:Pantothenate kinase [Vibrio stylophorae]|uniref:Pantothenate kinase n=1 Tax=Vibrio stylophorae TaxID=659351 RepID=A0ABM8ZR30_9VIBR|nr:type I pantothenate kinase [Vibrio stylophorae]CAH0532360.1 Pantothenate kinase [Vibrio stylophorae]